MKVEYNYYFWGPLLFRTTLQEEDIIAIKKLCKKEESNTYVQSLAGVIDHEYTVDHIKLSKIIDKYLVAFRQASTKYYNSNCPRLNINDAWVNYMKKGDSNPPHVHPTCDISSVMYLDVPNELLEEQKQWQGRGGGPGAITFVNQTPSPGFIGSNVFKPETGDFFIFPSMLTHMVATFKSDVERVSLSANFTFSNE